tara:strand:+ start:722 stop:1177 length:456 start_codon:yes stop_codon:yes gene_type:complete
MIEWHDPSETLEGNVLKNVLKMELDILKYQQEPSVENGVPMFMDHAGGVPVQAATGYSTNQVYPAYSDSAPASKPISEVYSMPASYQTGYDAKGSSLHMHMNDGGTTKGMYRDSVEDSMSKLTTIKKSATAEDMQVINEIEDLLKQIETRL